MNTSNPSWNHPLAETISALVDGQVPLSDELWQRIKDDPQAAQLWQMLHEQKDAWQAQPLLADSVSRTEHTLAALRNHWSQEPIWVAPAAALAVGQRWSSPAEPVRGGKSLAESAPGVWSERVLGGVAACLIVGVLTWVVWPGLPQREVMAGPGQALGWWAEASSPDKAPADSPEAALPLAEEWMAYVQAHDQWTGDDSADESAPVQRIALAGLSNE